MQPTPETSGVVPITEVDVARYYADYVLLRPDQEEYALGIFRNPNLSLDAKADQFNGMSTEEHRKRLEQNGPALKTLLAASIGYVFVRSQEHSNRRYRVSKLGNNRFDT